MSNLTKALAVVSLLAPASAQPLGIGEIELHSALNQNLNAEIRLTVAPGENPSDVSVKLAPPEKFDKAGVVWNYFLSKVKLEPVVQANGSIVVKVTSREALTEPFLDFLVEVSWPQGSMTREFTLLIDPPTAYNQPATPVVATTNFSAEPIEYPAERPTRKAWTAPKRAVRTTPTEEINPQTPTSGEFGPVQKSDTLWSIANQLGQEKSVPTQQMLMALYRANPDAFNNGNINSLKEGATLKIPETAAILKPGQAPTERKAVSKPSKPETTQTASQSKPLELVAPTEAKVAENAIAGGQGKPQSDSTNSANQGATGGTGRPGDGKDLELQARIEKLEQQLSMMQQLLALKDQQLASLQNNKQAPAAPAEIAATTPSTTPAPVPTEPAQQSAPTPAATPAQAPTQTPEPETKPAPIAPPTAPKPAPVPTPPPVVAEEDFFSSDWFYLLGGGLGAGLLGGLGWLFWRKRQIDERTNTESMFASASQIRLPDSESSLSVPIMDIGSTDEYDVGTVGESSFISDFTPSDFDAFDTDQNEVDPISEADVYLAYGRYQQAEELIRHAIADQPNRDECKLKLLEIFYASENKESFARYAQELADAGKQADKPFWKKITDMAKEIIPESTLFFGDSAAVTNLKSASGESGNAAKSSSSSSEDATLAFLGDDLSDLDIDEDLALEDNGLDFDLGSFGKSAKQQQTSSPKEFESVDFDDFASSQAESDILETLPEGASEMAADSTTPANSAQTDDSGLDLSRLDDLITDGFDFAEATKSIDSQKTATQDAFESFDFNFDTDTAKAEVAGKADTTPTDKAQLELETFDFVDFAPSSRTPAKPEAIVETKPLGDLESFEFDFDTIASTPSTETNPHRDGELDLDSQLKLETFDFSDFDNITPKSAETTRSKTESVVNNSAEFDFNFDFDAPIISAGEENQFDLGVSDLTDMDEFETKIDLAKAYIDMGDADAARSIAEDVLSKGSKQQQLAAQAILDELK